MGKIIKNSRDPREFFTPQMSTYDNLGVAWHPYIMFFQEANYISEIVNTDKFGFRFSTYKNNHFSPYSNFNKSDNHVSFVVGSSAVFGVGATNDSNTISSLLTNINGEKYLNFGCRAHVSSQELILFNQISPNFRKIKNVIIFSGLNDLYLSFLRNYSGELGPFFFGKQYSNCMNKELTSNKRKLIKYLISPFFGESIDYKNISIKDLIKKIIKFNETQKTNYQKPNTFDVKFTISQLRRNLFIWKKLSQSFPFNLIFVLQPTLDWMAKVPCNEEKEIFEFLNSNDDQMKIREVLSRNIYKQYSFALKELCKELEINFFDSNSDLSKSIKDEDWIFVDRGGHMTDLGYDIVSKYLSEITKNIY